MAGQACHEAASCLQHRRAVVLDRGLDIGQRQPDGPDDLEWSPLRAHYSFFGG